jgi:hypothetical protein
MTTVHTLVGYKLIKVSDSSVVQLFGPTYPPPPVPSTLTLPGGDIVTSPSVDVDYNGYMLIKWIDDIELPVQQVFSAEQFIMRFGVTEYKGFRESDDLVAHRFWDILLANGQIDVRSERALLAKGHFVDEGILTQDRADAIWDTVPSSIIT